MLRVEIQFRSFYLWLRSSLVLPFKISRNRLFVEKCLSRRKLFSSYSNIIQNSLWPTTKHPLFSYKQFTYFKTCYWVPFRNFIFIPTIIFLIYWSGFLGDDPMTVAFIRLLKTIHTFCIDLALLTFIILFHSYICMLEDSGIHFLAYLADITKKWLLLKIKSEHTNSCEVSDDSDESTKFKATNSKQTPPAQISNFLFHYIHILKTPTSLPNPYGCVNNQEDLFKKNYFLPSSNLNPKSNYFYFKTSNNFNYWSFFDARLYSQLLQTSLQQFWPLNYTGTSFNDLRLFSNLNSLFCLPIVKSSVINFSKFNKLNFSTDNSFYTFLFRQLWFNQYSFMFKHHKHRPNMFKFNELSDNNLCLSLYKACQFCEYVNLLNYPTIIFNNEAPQNYLSSLSALNFNLLSEKPNFLLRCDFDFFSVLNSDSFFFNLLYTPNWECFKTSPFFYYNYIKPCYHRDARPRINFFL